MYIGVFKASTYIAIDSSTQRHSMGPTQSKNLGVKTFLVLNMSRTTTSRGSFAHLFSSRVAEMSNWDWWTIEMTHLNTNKQMD